MKALSYLLSILFSLLSVCPAFVQAESISLWVGVASDEWNYASDNKPKGQRSSILKASRTERSIIGFKTPYLSCPITKATLQFTVKSSPKGKLTIKRALANKRFGQAVSKNVSGKPSQAVQFDITADVSSGQKQLSYQISSSQRTATLIWSRESKKGARIRIVQTCRPTPLPSATPIVVNTPVPTLTPTPTSTPTPTPTATATPAYRVAYGPYIQKLAQSSGILRWATDIETDTRLIYGTSPSTLNLSYFDPVLTKQHRVALTGLTASTRYYYSVGSSSYLLTGGSEYFFDTNPAAGTTSTTRIWAISDYGTGTAIQTAVRDAYLNYTGTTHTNLLLTTGDNAYQGDETCTMERVVFGMYPSLMRNTAFWPAFGNHDAYHSTSSSLSGPYYDLLSLPRSAEAGGVASNTEAYYSFDYGDAHFITLDPVGSSMEPGSAMLNWLVQDLAANTKRFVVAYFHYPPYSNGPHKSDTDSVLIKVRENIVPLLEDGGVDLVLSGHSHNYERSYFIDGYYGKSGDFSDSYKKNPGGGGEDGSGAAYHKHIGEKHGGAVFVVAGTGGMPISWSATHVTHPVMFHSEPSNGSLVIDIEGSRLTVKFLTATGTINDHFTIIKD